jgi:hypothetical protein
MSVLIFVKLVAMVVISCDCHVERGALLHDETTLVKFKPLDVGDEQLCESWWTIWNLDIFDHNPD